MHVLGIQIDAPFVRAALLRINGRKIELRALKSSLLSEPEDVKQLYTKDFNGRIVSGISPKSLLIRPIELKIGKTRLVEEALTFQSEASSHFNPAEVLTIPLVKKKEETSTEALVFTIPRSGMKEHLLELQKLQIDPDRVSAISSALCSFIRWKFPNLSNAFIVDLGSNEWSSVWMEKGFLKKSYAASGGVETLLKALLEDRKKVHLQKEIEGAAKQIDLLQLKTHLNPHLAAKLAELRQEVVKAIYSFHREGGAKPLIFIGRMDTFIHLREFIIESLESSVFLEHEEALTLDEQKFAGVIGLALEERSPYRLQFRREEFFPEKNWKRLGIYTCALFALSVLLSGTLFSFSNWATNRQKQEMVDSIHDYLMGWDSSQKKKILSSSFSEEETVEKWVAAVETHNKEYPYIPQAPKMAEVLYWITTHPLIESLKKENDPISMREIRYQLVKFPKIGSPREPYLVKIEMEFQFKSGINARKFHEALLKGDEWVDSRQEVTWDALNDGYRASFFLKIGVSMLFERLFIRIGKFFFFTVRPFFTFAILCLPLLCALGAIYLQGTRLEELEERFTVAMRKGKAAFERKDRKERFLVRYLQTDPYFLDQQMESTLFLSQEKQRLEALLPAFPLNTAIQQRYEYIVKYNKLQFTEENIRASSLIKETDEKQRHPIQVNETDLQQLLAIIEDIPVGPYLPPKLGPQFLIRDIRLKKQSTDLQTEILEVEMDLLKREFIK